MHIFIFSILIFSCLGLISGCSEINQDDRLVLLYESPALFKSPESIAFDNINQALYVSNINRRSSDEGDGDGFISKLSVDGKMISLHWVDGLNDPKGVFVSGESLWVADIDELIEVSTLNGKVISRTTIPAAKALNDVLVDKRTDTVLISDFHGNQVFSIRGDQVRSVRSNIKNPNGLALDEDGILVGTFTNKESLFRLGVEGSWEAVLPLIKGNVDGLIKTQSGDIIKSDFSGTLSLYENEASCEIPLLKLKNENIGDFAFIETLQHIVIPSLNSNKIRIYRLLKNDTPLTTCTD